MQRNDMAEKKRVLIDGEELPGLFMVGEVSMEKGSIEVPEFKRIRVIQNGIIKIPTVQIGYKVQRNSKTLAFLRNWFFKDEDHDVTIIRTDAAGVEFARTLLTGVELLKYTEPPFDGVNPTFAKCEPILVPWDLIPVGVL